MGDVYRARDPRLAREVAIKVLPDSISSDPGRLRRFAQEARATSSLNHPNILTIFDVGESDRTPFVVSELLDGQTLREILSGGPLPRRRALEHAVGVAHGLAAAHEKGIVHRDLKPENLFVTRDGRVKILDFGLAKLTRPEREDVSGDGRATRTEETQPGTVLGTVAYMSPEQVRGKPADHRSDLFALGAILYEMLAGRRAFAGETAADSIGAILREDPLDRPGTAAPLPPSLESVVRHCLEKNPEERFQSARDLAFALEAATTHSSATGTWPSLSRPVGRIGRAVPLLVAALAGAALIWWLGRSRPPEPSFERLTFRRGRVVSARFAPDSRTVIYNATWEGGPLEIHSTRVGSRETQRFPLAPAGLFDVSSSGELAVGIGPERRRLARISLAGGSPRELLEDVTYACWSPDGKALAVTREMPGRTRLEYPIGRLRYETTGGLSHIRVSPDGESVAFFDHPVRGDSSGSLALVDGRNTVRRLSEGWRILGGLAWAPGGKEIWFSGARDGPRSIFAVDRAGRERTVLKTPGRVTLVDVSPDGTALMTGDTARVELFGKPPEGEAERSLSWLDWSFLREIAPDGLSVLFNESGEGGGPEYATYLARWDGAPPVRLGQGTGMAISPDGRWVIVRPRSAEGPISLVPTGAGVARPLPTGGIRPQRAGFFPDGKRIYVSGAAPGRPNRLYAVSLADGRIGPITAEGVRAGVRAVSPDGAAILGQDSEGRFLLYPTDPARGAARPLPGFTASEEEQPVGWTADGRSIYVYRRFRLPSAVFRLDVATGARELWKEITPADRAGADSIWSLGVTPDGRAYAYSFGRTLSDLYVAQGLR
jgi:Tol biopolymer transport system component